MWSRKGAWPKGWVCGGGTYAFGGRAALHGLRVGPEQLAHDALLGRLAVALGAPDVVERHVVAREQAAVHAQHAPLHAVEAVRQRQPVVHLRPMATLC